MVFAESKWMRPGGGGRGGQVGYKFVFNARSTTDKESEKEREREREYLSVFFE